jgi:chloramphenicol-sensitive protein RarD
VTAPSELDRRGVALGVGAHVVWGLFPAFWPLLDPASPIEVLAHRILWTFVLMAGVLTLRHGWGALRSLPARGWGMVTAAAVLIAANWGLFIYGVAIGHVVEIALGYYIGPLINVVLGVLVLRERPRPLQWVALVVATAAVMVIAVGDGRVPWLGLALAVSFGTYGLIKKTVPLSSTTSLTAEGVVLGLPALALVVVLQLAGVGTLTGHGVTHVALLISAGPVTAVPLLLYGAAARRIPLTTLGTLMYLTPTLQFLWGVLVVGEAMPAERWVGFGLVWLALVIFTVDLLRPRTAPVTVPDPAAEAR